MSTSDDKQPGVGHVSWSPDYESEKPKPVIVSDPKLNTDEVYRVGDHEEAPAFVRFLDASVYPGASEVRAFWGRLLASVGPDLWPPIAKIQGEWSMLIWNRPAHYVELTLRGTTLGWTVLNLKAGIAEEGEADVTDIPAVVVAALKLFVGGVPS